ncbi:hypothetical protein ACERZ8_17320 [Tateyamaria armeniaca]|uniref:HTH cro/C1-type domain-containing protein n=1 Tax=Tateyamaria armeniaca TaxID=2518930 RepID=A0ABW8V036_9RHOB
MMQRGSQSKIDMLPQARRDKIVRDIVLGRMTQTEVAKKLKLNATTIGRYMSRVSEEERLAIIASAMGEAKVKDMVSQAEIVDQFGEDTDKDLKWVLRELKTLLVDAKGDEDRVLALGALKELRQSLMSLADLHGKLNKRMDVHLNLNESPQFIQLRKLILTVLERHPDAKQDFLEEMRTLQVIPPPKVVNAALN